MESLECEASLKVFRLFARQIIIQKHIKYAETAAPKTKINVLNIEIERKSYVH